MIIISNGLSTCEEGYNRERQRAPTGNNQPVLMSPEAMADQQVARMPKSGISRQGFYIRKEMAPVIPGQAPGARPGLTGYIPSMEEALAAGATNGVTGSLMMVEMGPDRADDAGVNEKAWFDPVEMDCPQGYVQYLGPAPKEDKLESDTVNHPSHYTDGIIECIEAIEAQLSKEEYRGYLKGNIAKYLWREKHKGGVESLKKAEWYLKRLIETDE